MNLKNTSLSLNYTVQAEAKIGVGLIEVVSNPGPFQITQTQVKYIAYASAREIYGYDISKTLYLVESNTMIKSYSEYSYFNILSYQDNLAVVYAEGSNCFIDIYDGPTAMLITTYQTSIAGLVIKACYYGANEVAIVLFSGTTLRETRRVQHIMTNPIEIKASNKRLIGYTETHVYYYMGTSPNTYIRREILTNEYPYKDYPYREINNFNTSYEFYNEKLWFFDYNGVRCVDFVSNETLYTLAISNTMYAFGIYRGKVYYSFVARDKNYNKVFYAYQDNNLLFQEQLMDSDTNNYQGCMVRTKLYLPLQDRVMSSMASYDLETSSEQNLSLTETVIDGNTIILKEKAYADFKEDLSLKEQVIAGIADLPLEETIQAYTEDNGYSLMQEMIILPDGGIHELDIYENIKFKTGEWGTGVQVTALRENVIPVPVKELTLKENVIAKPVPIITATDVNFVAYKDEFNAFAEPVVVPIEQTKLPLTMAYPEVIYEDISLSQNQDYLSLGYDMRCSVPVSDKKRVIAIKRDMIYKIEISKLTARVYQLKRIVSSHQATADDFIVYNTQTGEALIEDKTQDTYSSNYIKFVVPKVAATYKLALKDDTKFTVKELQLLTYETFNQDMALTEMITASKQDFMLTEQIKSHKFFNYSEDGYIDNPVYINERDTITFDLNYSIAAGDYALFEVTANTLPVLGQVILHKNSNSNSYTSFDYDTYTIKHLYMHHEKQVYGFALKLDTEANRVLITNKGIGFEIKRIYSVYNPKWVQEGNLSLKENIVKNHQSLGLHEIIFEEDACFESYDLCGLEENIVLFEIKPGDKNLTLKESVSGLHAEGTVSLTEEVVITTEENQPYYMQMYLEEDNNGKIIKFPEERYNKDSSFNIYRADKLLIKLFDEVPEVFDWQKETFMRLYAHWQNLFDWHTRIDILIGFVYPDGSLEKFETILPTSVEGYEEILNITRFICTYLERNNIPYQNARIGYLGVNFKISKQKLTNFSIARPEGIKTKNLSLKEEVLLNDKRVEYPDYVYRENFNEYRPKAFALKIPVTEFDFDKGMIFTRFTESIEPTRLIIKTDKKIKGFYGKHPLGYEERYITPAAPIKTNNIYEYDINVKTLNGSPTLPVDRLCFNFVRETNNALENTVCISYVEVHFSGYKSYKNLWLEENIFDAIPYKHIKFREYITEKPSVYLMMHENVDKCRGGSSHMFFKEYVTTPSHIASEKCVALTEIIKHPTWERSLLLQENVPSEVIQDGIAVIETVSEELSKDLALKESIIVYKVGVDGKVMTEIVR